MDYPFVPFVPIQSEKNTLESAESFYNFMRKRRSLRHFSAQPIEKEIMEKLIMTASTAPSGANKQPWTFCLVGDPSLKKQIREAAEKEEFASYQGRMTAEWLEDLAPLGTDWQKPFLETAPWLVIIFKRAYEKQGTTHRKNYYVNESIGIACGFFLAAVHHAGLVALTHTPSPMDFLTKILNRPENERPYLLIPVGYPAEDATVPDIGKKSLEEIIKYF